MSGYILLGLFTILMLMVSYQSIADAYDAERWRIGDPDYCRYQASFRKVLAWWWRLR